MNSIRFEPSVNAWLATLLGLKDGAKPFPWQLALFKRLQRGEVVSTLDIPTGLGKTSVMALWLGARACGAPLPRRLVYVVDRRAVVDQATDVADHLRRCVAEDAALKEALGLERDLPVSTLRGQHVDNRDWLEDPTSPAIIVGTVDMIGSRLLFEGYGVSRKMRPYHAGLLGVDTLVVLDEAHLVPPFEKLLASIGRDDRPFGPQDEALQAVLPPFKFMSLSATGRGTSGEVFGLTDEDRKPGTITRQRLDARKRLQVAPLDEAETLPLALARRAWDLSAQGQKPIRCLIFSNERKVAQEAQRELQKLSKNASLAVETDLFVGGRRVYERQQAAERLKNLGFIAGSARQATFAAFLFATSAAEVGVDLDADHMVCDLVAWERMVQRLGRVNRRGEGSAEVVVVRAPTKDDNLEARLNSVVALLETLPALVPNGFDASPGAIADLKQRSIEEDSMQRQFAAASTPAPLHPPLTRPLLEAWSMTSLEVHTGRPQIEPWLRGWEVVDEPQTTIIWRDILPLNHKGELLADDDMTAYLTAASPQLVESLETETSNVIPWLKKRREALLSQKAPDAPFRSDQVIAVIVNKNGSASRLGINDSDEDKRNRLGESLDGAVLIVDTRLGGLEDGLLATESTEASDVARLVDDARVPFRVYKRVNDSDLTTHGARMRHELSIPTRISENGSEEEWLDIYTWMREPAETEEGRSVSPKRQQLLDEHQSWAEQAAKRIATRMQLKPPYAQMLETAARLHDEGKRAQNWQRAFGAPVGKVLAKSTTRPSQKILGNYRHELGSLPYAEKHDRFIALGDAQRELCLHVIAAHHGRARPTITIEGAQEPPSKLEERARQIAMRFAKLQDLWGPWGLAWWEALLRAADQQASRKNDEEGGSDG